MSISDLKKGLNLRNYVIKKAQWNAPHLSMNDMEKTHTHDN